MCNKLKISSSFNFSNTQTKHQTRKNHHNLYGGVGAQKMAPSSNTSISGRFASAFRRKSSVVEQKPERKPSISYKIPIEDFESYYDDMAQLDLDGTSSSNRNRLGSVGSRASIENGRVYPRASFDSSFSKATTLAERKSSLTPRVHHDMLHNLADFSDEDSDSEEFRRRSETIAAAETTEPFLPDALVFDPSLVAAREEMIESLSPKLWARILAFATPADACNLALASKSFWKLVGPDAWVTLNLPENKQHKALVLVHTDHLHPGHLLCFPCAQYHIRTQHGKERLEPNFVLNPLFDCPNVRNTTLPRMRLTHGRELPFSFVQLALRATRHSPDHGMAYNTLGRGWTCRDSEWTHRTQFYVHKGHLLFKCVSTILTRANLTQSEERLLLYSRSEYIPYFSVCAHWKDGELMNLCKCALTHVPKPRETIKQQLKKAPKVSLSTARTNYIVQLCEECKPMRRCPMCPTEYLITIKMVEDKKDRINTFKHAITLTRWSDLGDGTSPYSPEWAACTGQAEYDSFSAVGRRSVAGTFESETSNTPPGERLLSLNPKMVLKGEDGNSWY